MEVQSAGFSTINLNSQQENHQQLCQPNYTSTTIQDNYDAFGDNCNASSSKSSASSSRSISSIIISPKLETTDHTSNLFNKSILG